MALKVYNFKCICGKLFEAMVPGAEEADKQIRSGFLTCPFCGSSAITRSLSAPYIGKGYRKVERGPKEAPKSPAPSDLTPEEFGRIESMVEEAVQEFQKIVDATEDVGNKFVEEVRAIKDGTAPSRSIKGTASVKEVKELIEEGIDVLPLPPKPKLN